jgi:death-on-curing protein
VVDRFGGKPGVRDLGLLESALYRPQTGYYETLVDMAAALMESLLLNHAFVDGNKRAAFFVTDVFLRMNGYRLKVDQKAADQFIQSYAASNKRDRSELSNWLALHLTHA